MASSASNVFRVSTRVTNQRVVHQGDRIGASKRYAAIKRGADALVGAALLVAASPVMVGVAVAIRVMDGPPVFFQQERPGRDEKRFVLVKFKTMKAPSVGQDIFRSDRDRVTPLGSFLRRTSLDELPELINVVRGEMSLVGPRPLLVQYLPKYSDRHRLRHSVRPGLTGLAQTSGRRALTMSSRLDLDVFYVENMSFLLDMKLLAKTVLEPFKTTPGESQTLEEIDDAGFFSDE